jgi:hypothetical protein
VVVVVVAVVVELLEIVVVLFSPRLKLNKQYINKYLQIN